MLFQVERILDECKELGCLPDILVMENVPDLVNKKFIKDFQRWRAKLEQIGYSNFDEILNGKHFGIAQNRKREFMVSILGEYNYTMPKPIKLKHCLGDFLEDDSKVDKKYYLSEKMLNGMKHTKFNSYKLENRLQERERDRYSNHRNRESLSSPSQSRARQKYLGVFDFKESDTFRPTIDKRIHLDSKVSKTLTTRSDSCCVILEKKDEN